MIKRLKEIFVLSFLNILILSSNIFSMEESNKQLNYTDIFDTFQEFDKTITVYEKTMHQNFDLTYDEEGDIIFDYDKIHDNVYARIYERKIFFGNFPHNPRIKLKSYAIVTIRRNSKNNCIDASILICKTIESKIFPLGKVNDITELSNKVKMFLSKNK